MTQRHLYIVYKLHLKIFLKNTEFKLILFSIL